MQLDSLARRIDDAAPAAPLRKAALLLHSMAPADRRWMLAQVDAAQRDRLDALLAELQALDFPADPELLRESLRGAGPAKAAARSRANGASAWSVDEATRLLQHEPDGVIAAILSAGDWHWEAALLRRLGTARAEGIAAARERFAGGAASALVEAAMRVALGRVASTSGTPR